MLNIVSLTSFDREHHEIFDCVAAKKVKEAQKLLSEHTINVRKQVISGYKQMIEDKESLDF
ncbi:MAG: hypothetical protein BWK80_21685 [Desulfobacteraceae bacterium IS3]|nr:MAG: hypothetical protein BWK80_21685 [Desulfobacteraceae bacterium IS3]